MRIKDVKKEVSAGFVLVDSETNGTGKMNVEDLQETIFKDAKKSGTPKIKNIVIAGGIADCGTLNLTERTNEEGNQFILIPGSATSSVTIEDTDAAPLLLFVCNLNKNKFQALNLMPVKDDDGTILGYTFKESTGASLNIFGHQDTRFDGVNTYRPGSYGLRFRIQNNKTDTQGIMFKPDIATEHGGSIIGAGLLAYLPEAKGAGNYVVRVNGTIDAATGAHAGCFSLGEMLIPSGKNPQTLGTLGDAPTPVFALGSNGPGWYLQEQAAGGSSGGAESEIFVVKIDSAESGVYTADKTYEQIKEAYNAGKKIEAIYKVNEYFKTAELSYFGDDAAAFVDGRLEFDGLSFVLSGDQIAILADDSLMFNLSVKNQAVKENDDILILNYDSDENLGKTLMNNSSKKLKILRLNTNGEGSHFMDLNLVDSSSSIFGGVGPVEGVLSYVEVKISYSPYTDETTTTKTITPLNLQTT